MRKPPYAKFPEIISDEIYLREIRENELPNLIEISFYNAKPASTLDEALIIHEKITSDYKSSASIHWGIFDIATEKVLGTIGFYRGFNNEIGEIGCVLKPAFYGKGIMSKAITMVINFGFEFMGLTKIIAITDKQNIKAINLLERVNYTVKADLNNNEVEYQFTNISVRWFYSTFYIRILI